MTRIPVFHPDELASEHNWRKNQRAQKWSKNTQMLRTTYVVPAVREPAEQDDHARQMLSRRGQ